METQEIIILVGQAIGIVSFLISCIRYFLKKKASIIKLSIFVYIFYIIHYFMIGAFAGSYALVISLVRDTYLYQREIHHKKHRHRKFYNNAFVFIMLFVVYFSFMLLNIQNPMNILPLLAGVVYMSFEWFTTNKTTLKIASAGTNIPWIVYDVLTLSFAGIIADSVSFVVAFLGILKDKKLRKKVVKHNH